MHAKPSPTRPQAAAVDTTAFRVAVRKTNAGADRAQLDRSRALLADDRAQHLIPSIRSATISFKPDRDDDGQEVILREPSVEQGDWRDPADTTPNASHRPRHIHALRRANNLRTLRRRGTPLSEDHVTAGAIYQQDFELSQLNNFPGAPPPEVRGAPGPGDYSRMMDCGRNFRQASDVIGPLGVDLLSHVMLGHDGSPPTDISAWAATKQINKKTLDPKAAIGILIATLDLLVGHYGRKRIQRYKRNENG